MKSFKNYITEQTLLEATAEELYDKYSDDISKERYDILWKLGVIPPDENATRFGDYSKWLLGLFKKNDEEIMDAMLGGFGPETKKIQKALSIYDKAKKLRKIDTTNIDAFKHFRDLEAYINDQKFSEKELESKNEKEKRLAKEFEKVFENNKWTIIIPKTHEASKEFGSRKWCTAADSEVSEKTFWWYMDMDNGGPLYIITSKTSPHTKIQFHFGKPEFKDQYNADVTEGSDIVSFIKEHLGNAVYNFFEKRENISEFGTVAGLIRTGKVKPNTKEYDIFELNLISLKGSPTQIIGDFDCSGNRLKSLEGAPKIVGGSFSCSQNPITTLEGSPEQVRGYFNCRLSQLKSLKGMTQKIGMGVELCHNEKLSSLEGAPKEVRLDFNCSLCDLKSLVGAPKIVGHHFSCSNNPLTSLEGCPEKVGGSFYCNGVLGRKFTEEEIRKVCDVKGKVFVA